MTRDTRAERADTWQEAADQVEMIRSEKEDGPTGVFDGHPMMTLTDAQLEIVQAWLQEAAYELGAPRDR